MADQVLVPPALVTAAAVSAPPGTGFTHNEEVITPATAGEDTFATMNKVVPVAYSVETYVATAPVPPEVFKTPT